jgi:predicted CxxxxCH...CXXCH cytochrome family protein
VTGDTPITPAGSLTPVNKDLLTYWDPALDPIDPNLLSISGPAGAIPIKTSPNPCPRSYCASLSTLGPLTLNVPSNDTVTMSFNSISGTPLPPATLSANPLQGTPATIQTQVANLNYAPQPGCVTRDVAKAPVTSCTGTVSISDSLTASSVATPPPPGRINIDVQALAGFSKTSPSAPTSVFGMIASTCSGSSCHSAGGTGAGVTFWTYTPPAVPGDQTAIAAAIAATYSSIQCGSKNPPSTGACQNDLISSPTPANSHFYTALCGSGSQLSSGMSGLIGIYGTPTSPQCQLIYQWILEGALND